MMENGLVPPEPPELPPTISSEIDRRGWLTVIAAMLMIGWWSHRPDPLPAEPIRIPTVMSEPWMADALPGIGVKTREAHWQHVRAGDITDLPERARAMAGQMFTWPVVRSDLPSGNAHPQRP